LKRGKGGSTRLARRGIGIGLCAANNTRDEFGEEAQEGVAIYEENGRGGEGKEILVPCAVTVSCRVKPARLGSAPPRNFRIQPASATELSRTAERDRSMLCVNVSTICFAATLVVRWLDAVS